jgi:tetratricopeptide (TPR) repeat protein
MLLPSRLPNLRLLLCGALLWGLPGPANAQTRVDGAVATAKQRAAGLAAAKKWDAALTVIQDSRALVRSARRKDGTGVVKPPLPPQYRAAVAALNERLRKKPATGPKTRAYLDELKQEYVTEKQKLDRKYAVRPAGAVADWQAAEARVMARYDLVDADLAALEGTYQQGKGRSERARELREEAAARRLGAYRVLGRRAEAEKTAAALLALPARQPATLQAVGDFYQQAGRYDRAAQAWRLAVRTLEQGNPRDRRRLSPLFYRQLAFCYTRQGKSAEARDALARAQRAEQ